MIFLLDKVVYDNPFLNLDQDEVAKVKDFTGLSYQGLLFVTSTIIKNGGKELLESAFKNQDIDFVLDLMGGQNYEEC